MIIIFDNSLGTKTASSFSLYNHSCILISISILSSDLQCERAYDSSHVTFACDDVKRKKAHKVIFLFFYRSECDYLLKMQRRENNFRSVAGTSRHRTIDIESALLDSDESDCYLDDLVD